MISIDRKSGTLLGAALLMASLLVTAAAAQSPNANGKKLEDANPVHRLAEQPRAVQAPQRELTLSAAPGEHPLEPTLRWAKGVLDEMHKIQDYSCTFVKRERINGELKDPEYAYLKVRHQPFSVYMYFLDPPKLKGREVIYVSGRNKGKLWAHPNGIKRKVIGTISLDPTGRIAMEGNRYPLTDIGFLNLTRRLIEVGNHDTKFGECESRTFPGAKINGRTCTCIQAVHPFPRSTFRYHIARIYVDDELNIPIRYESYWWPQKKGGKPQLLEEYTYLNIKLNNGFTDVDFDPKNPDYSFP